MKIMNGSKKKNIRHILKGANREIAQLLMTAHDQGFRVSRTGEEHYKVMPPLGMNTTGIVFVPYTPSGYRTKENTKTKLRRIGVQFP